jgi:hypothetical protein
MIYADSASSITVPATGSQQVHSGASLLMGWSLFETTGTGAAVVEIYDGYDAGAQLLVVIALSPGQSTRDWLAGGGLLSREALFVRVVSGTVRGVAWTRLQRRNGS